MLFDDELKALLQKVKTVAIIGAVDKPGRPVDMVGRALMDAGLRIVPVHPVRRDVWGLPTYPSLGEVPVGVDLVDVFRAPEHCAAHAAETLALAPRPWPSGCSRASPAPRPGPCWPGRASAWWKTPA
jgi:predicted CoA-binding protein